MAGARPRTMPSRGARRGGRARSPTSSCRPHRRRTRRVRLAPAEVSEAAMNVRKTGAPDERGDTEPNTEWHRHRAPVAASRGGAGFVAPAARGAARAHRRASPRVGSEASPGPNIGYPPGRRRAGTRLGALALLAIRRSASLMQAVAVGGTAIRPCLVLLRSRPLVHEYGERYLRNRGSPHPSSSGAPGPPFSIAIGRVRIGVPFSWRTSPPASCSGPGSALIIVRPARVLLTPLVGGRATDQFPACPLSILPRSVDTERLRWCSS